jgi:hypothetical protein
MVSVTYTTPPTLKNMRAATAPAALNDDRVAGTVNSVVTES